MLNIVALESQLKDLQQFNEDLIIQLELSKSECYLLAEQVKYLKEYIHQQNNQILNITLKLETLLNK